MRRGVGAISARLAILFLPSLLLLLLLLLLLEEQAAGNDSWGVLQLEPMRVVVPVWQRGGEGPAGAVAVGGGATWWWLRAHALACVCCVCV
jgi:hypothetical protein